MRLTAEQYATLMKPLNATRVAKRSQGGKQLSYLESWDVRAHLIRVFGFTNFDIQTLNFQHVSTREYKSSDGTKDMIEIVYSAHVQLVIRDETGFNTLCVYSEGACGSASGPINMLGEHHDNALKTAVSDATKRCAINLGTQFGLSLYDNGNTRDVVKGTLVNPVEVTSRSARAYTGVVTEETKTEDAPTDEQAMETLKKSLGAEVTQ